MIVTPHISGASKGDHFPDLIWDLFLQNLDRLRAGRPLLNKLTSNELAGG